MARVKIEVPERFQFTTEIDVRVDDINYGGHLGNDALLSLLQEARVRMLAQHGMSELDVGGAGLIMADAAVVYRSEAFHGDRLRINVAVVEMADAGCEFVYVVTNAASGKEVARAKTGMVFFDYARRKIVRVTEKFKEALGGTR